MNNNVYTPEQREILDVRMALALIEQLHRNGEIPNNAMKIIRLEGQKMIDRQCGIC